MKTFEIFVKICKKKFVNVILNTCIAAIDAYDIYNIYFGRNNVVCKNATRIYRHCVRAIIK